MVHAQLLADGQSSGAVAFLAGGSGAQKRVGDLGHRADDDHRLLAESDAPGDDGRGAADGRRIFDRGAAKLHNYDAHANFPRLASNSALRIVAPAAPRIVL